MNTQLILDHVQKRVSLDEEEAAYFLSMLQEKQIRKKDFLLQAGEVSHQESFVIEGCLRSYYLDEDGQEHNTMFAIEDWWTGDLYSFLTQNPSSIFVDALEDSRVLQISRTNLEKLYENVPKFERFFRILMQNAYIANQQRIMQNLSFTAEQRYQEFQRKYPQLEQRVSQKHIASYLGITPEFLSMIRKRMSRG